MLLCAFTSPCLPAGNNAVEMQTTAHFDPATDEFIINSERSPGSIAFYVCLAANSYTLGVYLPLGWMPSPCHSSLR